jgi:hypothetical protein
MLTTSPSQGDRRHQCIHCKLDWEYNPGRLVDHILKGKCKVYDPIAAEIASKEKQIMLPFQTSSTSLKKPPLQRQQKLAESNTIQVMIRGDHKANLDALAALAVYGDGRPFSLFESPYMREFLKALNSAYSPPSSDRMSHTLLDQAYTDCQAEIQPYLDATEKLNVIFDETTAIGGRRVINVIVGTEQGPFFYRLITIPQGESATAENFAKYLQPVLHNLCGGDYLRINSFSTDTCATMRRWWRLAKATPELSHCLFIPCDSHGLQLLIKDIVELPEFKPTMSLASKIIQTFHHSGKQQDLLRSHQLKLNGKYSHLASSIITRWGTQYRMLKSLETSFLPLRAYVDDDDYEALGLENKKKEWLRPTVRDGNFWNTISLILRIIQPIHEAQVMSESDHSDLIRVKKRWDDIEAQLKRTLSDTVNFGQIMKSFYKRRDIQLRDEHFLAHYISPTNVRVTLSDQDKARCFASLESIAGSREASLKAKQEFYDFRGRRGVYAGGRSCWSFISSPLHFWDDCDSEGAVLPHIARRLATTIANSVPSERAFSTMNLVHSKLRNRLVADRVEKQVYIHINRRILDHPPQARQLFNLTEQDWLDMETRTEIGGEQEKELQLCEASDLSDGVSNGEVDSDQAEEESTTQANLQLNIEPLQSLISTPNRSKKRRNSSLQESISRRDLGNIGAVETDQFRASPFMQYHPQGVINVVNSYNVNGQSQGPLQACFQGQFQGWQPRSTPMQTPIHERVPERRDLAQHGVLGDAGAAGAQSGHSGASGEGEIRQNHP